MAIINLVTLRLSSNIVANAGAVAGQLRKGSNNATGQTPTTFLSFTRHPSYPSLEIDSRMDDHRPERLGMDYPGKRAGRLGCLSGVLSCPILAVTAGSMLDRACSQPRKAGIAAWSITGKKPVLAKAVGSAKRTGKTRISPRSLPTGLRTIWQAREQQIWGRQRMATA